MIRIVAVSGSPIKDGNTEAYLQEALRETASDPEIQRLVFRLGELEIESCRHCNWCVKNQTPEKFCVIDDGMVKLYPALLLADIIILATPVHICRMSGLMANMIDRMRVFTYGNVHGGRLKNKVGGALVVAFFRHGGLETTLSLLNQTFTLFQMIGVGCGGMAVTSTHGTGKIIPGQWHMVLEDAYGITSASQMIQRAVEIARIMDAGKKALHIAG